MDNSSIPAVSYDGVSCVSLAERLGVPHVVAYASTGSTLDEAHRLAAHGAASGTLVLAERQTAGRGRNGRAWSSPEHHGIWLTLVARPTDKASIEVLSLRTGLAVARALDPFAPEPARVKWPNDVYLDTRKVAGILVEARWREERPEWVAIGIGVNVVAPSDQENATGLEFGVRRLDVLEALATELRDVLERAGALRADELEEYDARDLARGRACVEPARGRVRGITDTGALIVELADSVVTVRSGSLVLEEWE